MDENLARQLDEQLNATIQKAFEMPGDTVENIYRLAYLAGQRAAFEEAVETCRDHVADISDMINTPTDFRDPIDDCTYAKYDTAVDLSDILRKRAAEVGKEVGK